jgi:hypothetical protein
MKVKRKHNKTTLRVQWDQTCEDQHSLQTYLAQAFALWRHTLCILVDARNWMLPHGEVWYVQECKCSAIYTHRGRKGTKSTE